MPKYTSCSYRASSVCGYPAAAWRIHDPELAEDFDITYATKDGIASDNDLDGWDFELLTDDNYTM